MGEAKVITDQKDARNFAMKNIFAPRLAILSGIATLLLVLAGTDYFTSPASEGGSPAFAAGLFTVAVMLFAAMFLRSRDNQITVIICVLSVIAATYAAEVYVSLRMGRDEAGQVDPLKDARLKVEVVDDLVAKGVHRVAPLGVYPMFQSSKGMLQPLSGLSNSHSVGCNEQGEWIVFELDRFGYNNPSNTVWESSPDIAVVGASTSFGLCVRPGESLTDRLRMVWPKTLNLSFIGSGPASFLRRIYEYLPALRPKVVLIEYNDWLLGALNRENLVSLGFGGQPPTLIGERIGLIEMQDEIDAAIVKEINAAQTEERPRVKAIREGTNPFSLDALKNLMLISSIRKSLDRSRIFAAFADKRARKTVSMSPKELAAIPEASPANLETLRLVLQRAKEFVAGWGGRVVFVYMPLYPTFDQHVRAGFTLHDKTVQIAREVGVDVIDLEYALYDHPEPFSMFSAGGGHYNTAGHKYVGDGIIDAIKKTDLLAEGNS